jgi:hypothetical protein
MLNQPAIRRCKRAKLPAIPKAGILQSSTPALLNLLKQITTTVLTIIFSLYTCLSELNNNSRE